MKESVRRMHSVEKNTAAELAKNWHDGDNEMFPFCQNSDKGSKFKKSTQGECINSLVKFSEIVVRYLF